MLHLNKKKKITFSDNNCFLEYDKNLFEVYVQSFEFSISTDGLQYSIRNRINSLETEYF